VEYVYDTEERLVGLRNQRSQTFSLIRDPLGRVIEETDYWGQTRRFQFDAGGYVTGMVDALGRQTSYTTDALGRLVRTLLPDGDTETFTYDPSGDVIEGTVAPYALTAFAASRHGEGGEPAAARAAELHPAPAPTAIGPAGRPPLSSPPSISPIFRPRGPCAVRNRAGMRYNCRSERVRTAVPRG
jgi:YD repeat-containing protein